MATSRVMAVRPGVTDVHTHAFDPDLPDFNAPGRRELPTAARLTDGLVRVDRAGRPYRTLDERSWSVEARLRDMDAEGVDLQVLSPMPVTLGVDADAGSTGRLARHMNDFLAGMVSEEPRRFAAFGAVALQDPAAAVMELQRCMEGLGFWGVEIGPEVGERPLSDPAFDPFWTAAEALGAVVFLHPVDHCVDPRIQRLGAGFGLGMPTETATGAADLLLHGVLDDHPDLRVCLAHGGGTLPGVLPRLSFGQTILPAVRPGVSSVASAARRLWCDSLTYDAASLRLSAARFGEDHLVLGTDYPFTAREVPAGAVLYDSGLDDAFRARVWAGNAAHLFRTHLEAADRRLATP